MNFYDANTKSYIINYPFTDEDFIAPEINLEDFTYEKTPVTFRKHSPKFESVETVCLERFYNEIYKAFVDCFGYYGMGSVLRELSDRELDSLPICLKLIEINGRFLKENPWIYRSKDLKKDIKEIKPPKHILTPSTIILGIRLLVDKAKKQLEQKDDEDIDIDIVITRLFVEVIDIFSSQLCVKNNYDLNPLMNNLMAIVNKYSSAMCTDLE